MPYPLKNNPAFLPEEELVSSFLVRQRDLELLLEDVRENTGRNANRHVLVIGARGMGKTTLVRRLAIAVLQDPDLATHWYPLLFSEESYGVLTVGEFWLEALLRLADQTGESRWRDIGSALRGERDEQRLRERALARLIDFADEQNKRILLVAENLNMLFDQQQLSDQDAWDLRHTLQTEPRLMLLGTATSRFEQIERSDKALFELFRPHHLPPLDTEECRLLWMGLTDTHIEDGRIRPIEILTGGNPRLITIVSGVAAGRSFQELMSDLTRLVDEHTTYFKANLEVLPAVERKVFVTLADLWEPATSAEVARRSRLEVSKTSSYLKRLEQRGAVTVVRQEGRRIWYQVTERLFNIYHLMRSRGGEADRVRALVDFMIHFYDRQELVNETLRLLEEACTLPDEPYVRQLRESMPGELWEVPGVVDYLGEDFLEAALAEPIGKRRDDTEAWFAHGRMLEKSQRFDQAEQAFRRAIELQSESARAWISLGILLAEHLGRPGEAERAFRRASEIQPDSRQAWGWLAGILTLSGKNQDAEHAFHTYLELDPEDSEGWYLLSMILSESIGRYMDAEKACRQALDLNEKHVGAWTALGLLQQRQKNWTEAESSLRQALTIDSTYPYAWGNLGAVLEEQKRNKEAEEAYRRTTELRPEDLWPWRRLGKILMDLERYEEAVEACRQATELSPESAESWRCLAEALYFAGRSAEAEQPARQALQMKPSQWAYLVLGQVLQQRPEGIDEAEICFRKVIELDEKSPSGWFLLGQLLMHSEDKQGEAERALERAAENGILPAFDALQRLYLLQKRPAGPRLLELFLKAYGQRPSELHRLASSMVLSSMSMELLPVAHKLVRLAAQLAPDNGAIQHTLASILGRLGRWEESLVALQRCVADPVMAARPTELIELCIEAAAAGHSKDLLAVLPGSPCAPALEPLLVALRLEAGEQPSAPVEVLEVARDVRARISLRREARQNQAGATAAR